MNHNLVNIIQDNIQKNILFISKKTPLRMTRSLTVDTGMCLPIEEEIDSSEEQSDSKEELSDLDQLVIDTSLNISSKLCLSAAQMMEQTNKMVPVTDQKILQDVESLSFVLEDSHIVDDDPQHQLACLLRNLKKIEQAIKLTKNIFEKN